jgi:hypothetical protein
VSSPFQFRPLHGVEDGHSCLSEPQTESDTCFWGILPCCTPFQISVFIETGLHTVNLQPALWGGEKDGIWLLNTLPAFMVLVPRCLAKSEEGKTFHSGSQ